MKSFLLLACIIGTAICVPQMMFMEFDLHHAPAQALQAVPPGAVDVEVLFPLNANRQPIKSRGFIKQEIAQAPGQESIEILHPFGFPAAAPAAPPAPPAPVAPVIPAAAPVPITIVLQQAPPRRKSDEDDEEDD